MNKIMSGLLLCVPLMGLVSLECCRSYQFTNNVGGHLKRAADANTLRTAQEELTVAVTYLEDHGITSGYTSVLYRTPDEDVGFWYKNLKESQGELTRALENREIGQLEASNVLMKLRETLVDHGKEGDSITAPSGIEVFPNNKLYALGDVLGLLLAAIGAILIFITVSKG